MHWRSLALVLWGASGLATASDKASPADNVRHVPVEPRTTAVYRGRTEPRTAAETLAWIPRVVLYPVHLVAEYGLRKPVYAIAGWIDRHHVVPIIEKVLNPTPNIRWGPTLSLDTGADTFVGAKGDWNNMLVTGHSLGAGVAFGGLKAWQLKATDRWRIGPHVKLGTRADYELRSDRVFYGVGPLSLRSSGVHFALEQGNAAAFASFEHRHHLSLELAGAFRRVQTNAATSAATSTVPSRAAALMPDDSGVSFALATVSLTLDSRASERISGVRLLANAAYASDLRRGEHSFASTEADLEGALEISRPDRVLAARVYAKDMVPAGKQDIPFTQLASLGGDNHVGFNPGRFRGESALMGELRYRYPIAYSFDAQWTASVGNAFARHFQDFKPSLLTTSLGFGLRTRRATFGPFELVFAVGTSRFDEPFKIESVRLSLSTTERL